MPIFKVSGANVTPLHSSYSEHWAERTQQLFEANLQEVLDVTFLANYSTTSDKRIDTLGIDANGAPCTITYKKAKTDDIVNRAIIGLQWLREHKAEFEALCRKWNIKSVIHWSTPKLFCIAEKFSKADIDAVDRIRNEEAPLLLRCRLYDQYILLIEPENI